MALLGLRAKCGTGVEWMDTPYTVMTTRAPAVLKKTPKLNQCQVNPWAL